MGEVTELLRRATADDRCPIDQIIAIVYSDLRRAARARLAGNDTTTLLNAMATGIGDASDSYGAFLASGLGATRAKLERLGVASRERTVPRLGLHQVCIEDPSGVVIELNDPSAEA